MKTFKIHHAIKKADIRKLLESYLLRTITLKFLGNQRTEVIQRPGCYIIRLAGEKRSGTIRRIILLPPKGFTGDEINLLNPHPEARMAKVFIEGVINPSKRGFSPLVNRVEFRYSLRRQIPTEADSPYAISNRQYCETKVKSWRNWFFVVKESGWGNFHSFINLADKWVLLKLQKTLLEQHPIRLTEYLRQLPKSKARKLKQCIFLIQSEGDAAFGRGKLITDLLRYNPNILIPILIQMLNTQETGKHEPCTFFALLLKLSRVNKKLVLHYIADAMKEESAPAYYLTDLIKKLNKKGSS